MRMHDVPLTGPLWILFIRCVAKPAIWLRNLFEGMMATYSRRGEKGEMG